jgi:hypothetical protein
MTSSTMPVLNATEIYIKLQIKQVKHITYFANQIYNESIFKS